MKLRFTNRNKLSKTLILLILFLAAFLRFYKLPELMPFIGDQGWFYLSARDLIVGGNFPLVGITASYTWLHQGAFWTYMLAPTLWLFKFNPLAGGILSATIGVLSVYAAYFVAKELSNDKKTGIISAFIFAASPIAIANSQMPYHTSPVPFLLLIFIFSIYKYSKGKALFLPVSAFVLGLLYNFVLATMALWILLPLVVYLTKKINPRLAVYSVISFLIPMIPMIAYDLGSEGKFYQLSAFIRIIKLSLFDHPSLVSKPVSSALRDLFIANKDFVFIGSELISGLITLGAIVYILRLLYINYKKKKINYSLIILFSSVFLPLVGILGTKTVSGAYLPMLFPGVILLIAYFLGDLIKRARDYKILIYSIVLFICLGNIYLLLHSYSSNSQITYPDELSISKKIVQKAKNRPYNLYISGKGSKYESYIMPYVYLTWWLGNGPAKSNEKLKFYIHQDPDKIDLKVNNL